MAEQKTITRNGAGRQLWIMYKKVCQTPISEVISFADYDRMLERYESTLKDAEKAGVDEETLEYHRDFLSELKDEQRPRLIKPGRNLELVAVGA